MELKPADHRIFLPRAGIFVKLRVLDSNRNLVGTQGHKLYIEYRALIRETLLDWRKKQANNLYEPEVSTKTIKTGISTFIEKILLSKVF